MPSKCSYVHTFDVSANSVEEACGRRVGVLQLSSAPIPKFPKAEVISNEGHELSKSECSGMGHVDRVNILCMPLYDVI